MAATRCTLILCAASLLAVPVHADKAPDRTLSILFTHDLHSHVLPQTITGDDGVRREIGGFARLAGAIAHERSRHPASTLVLDAGDYSMGTLFQTLVMDRAVELRLMGVMGYDAGTFGNHDLDFRLDGIERSLITARRSGDRVIPLLLSNFTIPPGTTTGDSLRAAFDAYGVQDHMVIERGGIRIGIFALMGKDAAKDCPFLGPASFRPPPLTLNVLSPSFVNRSVSILSYAFRMEERARTGPVRRMSASPGRSRGSMSSSADIRIVHTRHRCT